MYGQSVRIPSGFLRGRVLLLGRLEPVEEAHFAFVREFFGRYARDVAEGYIYTMTMADENKTGEQASIYTNDASQIHNHRPVMSDPPCPIHWSY